MLRKSQDARLSKSNVFPHPVVPSNIIVVFSPYSANLYTAIDSSPFAEINEEELKVYPTKNPEQSIRSNTPSIDKADGTADGVVWPINSDSENYFGSATTILSNGAVAEAWKDPYVEEEDEFEDNFNELPETLESMENNNNF